MPNECKAVDVSSSAIKSLKRRIARLGRIILAIVGVLFIAGTIFLMTLGPADLVSFLKTRVAEETNFRYSLEVDALDYRLADLSVRMDDVALVRDTAVNQYSGIAVLDQFDVNVTLSKLEIDYFRLLRFVLFNKLVVSKFSLEDPYVEFRANLSYEPSKERDFRIEPKDMKMLSDSSLVADTATIKKLQESGSVLFPELIINELSIQNGSFVVYDGKKAYPIREIRGLNVELREVDFPDEKKLFSAERTRLEIRSSSVLVSDNTARLDLRGLKSTDSELSVDTLRYHSIVDPSVLNQIKGFRATWLDVVVSDVDLTGIDLYNMTDAKSLRVQRADVARVALQFYKEKSDPRINPAYKALPAELIRNMPFEVKIDTIEVADGDLYFSIHADGMKKPGRFHIGDVTAKFTNLTNIEDALKDDRHFKAMATGIFENAGTLELAFDFDLLSPDNAYTNFTRVGRMPLTKVNPIIQSQLLIEFREGGILDHLEMSYKGDRHVNVGEMDFEYTDFHLQRMQNYEEYSDRKAGRQILAGLGNLFVNKNRSKEQKHYLHGVVYYEKEYNRDVMHGLIMSLMSGVKSSLGLGLQDEARAEEKAAAIDSRDLEKSKAAAQKEYSKASSPEELSEKEKRKLEKKKRREERRKAKKNKKDG